MTLWSHVHTDCKITTASALGGEIVSDSHSVVILTPWTMYKVGTHLGKLAFLYPPTQPVHCSAVDMALTDKYKPLGGICTNLDMKMGTRGHIAFSSCFRKLVIV